MILDFWVWLITCRIICLTIPALLNCYARYIAKMSNRFGFDHVKWRCISSHQRPHRFGAWTLFLWPGSVSRYPDRYNFRWTRFVSSAKWLTSSIRGTYDNRRRNAFRTNRKNFVCNCFCLQEIDTICVWPWYTYT